MHTQRLTGVVSKFFPDKNYGFIKTPEEDNYFFYQSELNYQSDFSEGLILKRYEALIGDTVSFVLRPNYRPDDPPIAAGLIRMINYDRLRMIEMSLEKKYLIGTLKKLGNEFFVRHRDTGAWVKVVRSALHKNPDEWMEEKIQFWVKFKINYPKGEEKVCAHLTEIPLRSKVQTLIEKIENAERVEGKVVHRSNAGITVIIKGHFVNGNLSIKSAISEEEKAYFDDIKIGDLIQAYPIAFDFEKELAKLDLFRPKEPEDSENESQTGSFLWSYIFC